MRLAAELTHDELIAIVQAVQAELYLDCDDVDHPKWDPEKNWSGADVLQNIARTLDQFGLVPAELSAASESLHGDLRSH